MASIEYEQAQEQARMAAERAAGDHGGPQQASANMMPSDPGDGGGGGNGGGPDSPGGPSGGGPSGPGGPDRAALEKQARDLLSKYGIKDPGNLDSLLTGRAGWDEFAKDTIARGTNNTGSRLYDSQGPAYNQKTNTLNPGFPATLPPINPNDPRVATTRPPGGGGNPGTFGGTPGVNLPGQIFNDPSTKLLEDLIKAQLGQLTQPIHDPLYGQYQDALQSQFNNLSGSNTELDKLLAHLSAQFDTLSQHPGYSPDERALLNTQTFEPIEALRHASQQREMDRTAQAGYLPTSGLHNQRMTEADRYYDQLRTVANRDLGVKEMDQRRADLAQAGVLGKDLVDIPQARAGQATGIAGVLAQLAQATRGEETGRQNTAIQLATILQRLPAQAQQEALAVINGTAPPESILPYVMQLAQNNQQNNSNFYAALGQLAGLFS